MNALELKTIGQRKVILEIIRDKFNGSVESQSAIAFAVSGNKTGRDVVKNLAWLVEHGYLTLTRTGGATKAYTLTEKAT